MLWRFAVAARPRDRLRRRDDGGRRPAPGPADHPVHRCRRRRSRPSPSVSVPDPGSAQTILLVGSDHRAGTPFKDVNTDTMMLVRLDPTSSTINLLSVPRDLKVQIPEGGALVTGKLNAAYFYGGPNLLIKILQQQVFPGLKVNHVVDVSFGGFEQMVNAIGCVYTDVDHRYYNNTAVTDYSSIDLQPGYQKLCGADALSFVRFRHTDSRHRPQRAPAGLHPLGQGPVQPGSDHQPAGHAAEDLRQERHDRPQPAHHRRADQPVRPGRVLGRAHDQADPVPGDQLPCALGVRRPEAPRPSEPRLLRDAPSRRRAERVPRVHDADQGRADADPPARVAGRGGGGQRREASRRRRRSGRGPDRGRERRQGPGQGARARSGSRSTSRS